MAVARQRVCPSLRSGEGALHGEDGRLLVVLIWRTTIRKILSPSASKFLAFPESETSPHAVLSCPQLRHLTQVIAQPSRHA